MITGEHIVDFACSKLRLVVEVDGAYHEPRFAHLDEVVVRISETARRLRQEM